MHYNRWSEPRKKFIIFPRVFKMKNHDTEAGTVKFQYVLWRTKEGYWGTETQLAFLDNPGIWYDCHLL